MGSGMGKHMQQRTHEYLVSVVFQSLKIVLLLFWVWGQGICSSSAEKVMIPANFVFGDSLVDAGNNNFIATLSKANYVPNGIDLGMPTGRYTNGRTIVDIIGQEMGLAAAGFTPPYLAPTTSGPVILQGVNFASGAAGILNETGNLFGGRINLDAQLDNFANTREDVIRSIGWRAARRVLENAMFSVTIGSNDFINNYFTPVVSTLERDLVPPQVFVTAMISKFRTQLTRVYMMGGRKVVVANVGPIGCIPYQRDINPGAGDDCVSLPNHLAQLFNTQLRSLVTELNSNLDGSIFVYADVYRIVDDIITNYTAYGFENANSACCYVAGKYGGLLPCGPSSKVCPDRSKYVFWDPYHPTDAANTIIANRLIDGDSHHIWPLNIRQLLSSSA
ncbi:PREDICTED: GDSL esterase/lipase At4g16230-like [Ipomoea nil]|uniref:GDSL esterase/lipase At4g16230-like n=1 Tax=Ipomoea nil TaxID=35883 RepID=UPI000900FFB6|nr:PREDICTED: GDSL esterase/lipase At4g16230-like [Ipomoea nil]